MSEVFMSATSFATYKPSTVKKETVLQMIGIPDRQKSLWDAIYEGFSIGVLDKLVDVMGVEKKTISSAIELSSATLHRRRKLGVLSREESDKLYRVAEIYQAAIDLFEGDVKEASAWMFKPAYALGDRKPIDCLNTVAESDAVLTLLRRLDQGVGA